MLKGPPAVGVPESEPPTLIARPAGPPDIDQLYTPEPPVAAIVTGPYDVPTAPSGSEVVVMFTPPLIITESVVVMLRLVVESVSVKATFPNVPATVGIPESTPPLRV